MKKTTNRVLETKPEFKFYPNLQRPRDKFSFNEVTKEVADVKGKIVGIGRVLKGTLIINFKTGKYEV